MKIVVTGGEGFIGSNIIKKLSLEHETYSISKDYQSILDISPDIVIHCGWYGGNSYKHINDVNQFHKNINSGTLLIEIIKQLPKVKFIGFGSFNEYGYKNFPVTEDVQEDPTDLYGLAKYTFKSYSQLLCEKNNVDWTWIRPCYVYGPGDVSTRLIPSLINKFLANEEVILDECNKVLDYIYIDDFVEMLRRLMLSPLNGIYNICSGKEYNLKDIINTLYRLTESTSSITYDSKLNRNSASYICGSNKKIVSSINYSPSVDLEVGLKATVNYYK